jgi:TP901 family phage tail tape measure protein
MADANANIRIDVDTSAALANIKNLQRQISMFHSQMAQGGAKAAAASAQMSQSLINGINATKGFSAELTTISSSSQAFTTALEKNKLSMGQYFRFAGASTKTFGKLFKSEFNTIEKVARERVKDLQSQYIKLGRNASGAISAIKVRPTTLDMQNLGTQTAMAAQKVQLFNQLVKQGTTNLLNWGKNTQWAGRQLMVGFTVPLTIFGTLAAKEFQKLEEQAIKFRRVYGDMFTTSAETEKALKNVRELADEFTKYGIAVEKTVDLAAKVAQMGNVGAALEAQVVQATRLSVLGGMDQMDALDTTISLTNAFKIEIEDLAEQINFLNAAENQTILAIEDFNTAIPLAGSVVKQLGGDVQDLAVLLTAMREGGINASQAGNALKSSLARLIAPSRNAKETLAGFGIDIMGIVEQNAGNLMGTINTLAFALKELDPLSNARAIEALFGKFQFARMSTLFSNIVDEGSQANKVLGLTVNSARELQILADRELGRVEESSATRFTKVVEGLKANLAPIGEAFLKAVTPIVEFISKILERFNQMGDGAKQFVVVMAAIGGVVAPALLMVVGLVANGIANLIKFVHLVGTGFGSATSSTKTLGEQTNYLNQQQLDQLAVASSLDQVHTTLSQTFTAQADAVANLVVQYDRAIQKQREFSAYGGAAGGAAGAAGRAAGAAPKKYASGVLSVPGPKGAGDVVPAMLSPGEAVIPTKVADKYRPLIQGIIADNIPGFIRGTDGVAMEEMHVGGVLPHTEQVVSSVSQTFLPGFDQLSAELKNLFIILGDLVATKSRDLNQAAKSFGQYKGKDFSDPEIFRQEWDLNEGEGFVGTGERALGKRHEDQTPEEQAAIRGMDTRIRDKVAEKLPEVTEAEKAVEGWLDRLIEAATTEVIDTMATAGTETERRVAGAMRDRKATPTTARTSRLGEEIDPATGQPYGTAGRMLEDLERQGKAERRPGQRELFLKDTNIAVGRPEYGTGAQRQENKRIAEQIAAEGGTHQFPMRSTAISKGMTAKFVPGGTYESGFREAKPGDPGVKIQPATDVFVSPESAGLPSEQTMADFGVRNGDAYSDGLKTTAKDAKDVASNEAGRSSPHPDAFPDGADDAKAYLDGQKSVLGPGSDPYRSGSPLAPPPPPVTEPVPQTLAGKITNKFEDSAVGQAIGRKLAKASGNALTDSKGNVTYDPNQDPTTWAGKMELENKAQTEAIKRAAQEQVEAASRLDTAGVELIQGAQELEQGSQVLENAARQDMAGGPGGPVGPVPMPVGSGGGKGDRGGKEQPQGRRGVTGRGIGLSMGISAISMGASMAPGAIGEQAQKAMPALMALSAAPMLIQALQSPLIAVVAAIAAVAGAIFMLNNKMKDAQKEAMELGRTLGSGTEAMKELAEFAGTVSAGEFMDKAREERLKGVGTAPGKTTFGESFVQDDQGQALVAAAKTQIAQTGDINATVNALTSKLATAVMTGVLTKEQASSMAANLGFALNNMEIGLQVRANIAQLTGPNGEDITAGDLVEFSAKVNEANLDSMDKQIDAMNRNLEGVFGDELGERIGGTIGLGVAGAVVGGGAAALIGAKIGATAGAALAPFTAGLSIAVGAGLGAIAGAVGSYFLMKDAAEEAGKLSGVVVANMTNALQQQQELSDAVDAYFLKKIEEAKVQGDITEQMRLQAEYEQKKVQMSEQEMAMRERMRGALSGPGAEAARAGISSAIETRFQDDADAKLVLPGIEAALKGFEEADRDTINLELASGAISPQALNTLLAFVGEDEAQKQALIDIVGKFGGVFADEAGQVMALIDDEDLAANILVDISAAGNEKEAQDIIDLVREIQKQDAVFDTDVILRYVSENEEVSDRLKEIFDKAEMGVMSVDQAYEVNPKLANAEAFNEQYFNMLPDVDKEQYVKTVSMILEMDEAQLIASDDFKKWTGDEGQVHGPFPGRHSLAKWQRLYAESMGQKVTSQLSAVDTTFEETEPEETSGGGGGSTPSSVIDDLLKKLRDLRNSQIEVTNGWVDSRNALDRLFDSGGEIKVFEGIEQQMRRIGAGEDLISMIVGMDPEDYERRKHELFQFDNLGNIIGATTALQNMGKAIRAIALGDFQSEQQRVIGGLNEQLVAFRKLTAAGLSAAMAYDAIKNAAFASAVAREKDNKVIRETIKLTRQAVELNRAFQAAQSIARKNQDVGDLRGVVGFIERNAKSLSEAQKSAILSDPELQTLIMNPTVDPNTLRAALANANRQADLELNIKKLTFEGLQEIFQDGFSRAMDAFSAQETEISIRFDIQKDPFLKIIQEAEEAISDIRNRAGGLDDLDADIERIARQEKEINDAYDKRVDALDKIEKINDSINRKQKSQLDVADALSRGDIAAAAQAARQASQEAAEASLKSRRDQLELSREKELSALIGNMGLTREQLEERIRNLQEEIFNIEEQRLEPAQRQVELLDREQSILVENLTVLGRTRQEWEAIQNQVNLANVNSEKFQKAMQEALSVVEDIVTYWDDFEDKAIDLFVNVRQQGSVEDIMDAILAPPPTPDPGSGGGDGIDRDKILEERRGQAIGTGGRTRGDYLAGMRTPRQYTSQEQSQALALDSVETTAMSARTAADAKRAEIDSSWWGIPGFGGGKGTEFAPQYQLNELAELEAAAAAAESIANSARDAWNEVAASVAQGDPFAIFNTGAANVSSAVGSLLAQIDRDAQGVITGNIGAYFTDLGINVPTFLQAIPEFWTKMSSEARQKLESGIGDFFKNLAANAGTNMAAVGSVLKQMPEDAKAAFEASLAPYFEEGLPGSLENIADWWGALPLDVKDNVMPLIQQQLLDLGLNAANDLEGTVGQYWESFPGGLQDLFEGEVTPFIQEQADLMGISMDEFLTQRIAGMPEDIRDRWNSGFAAVWDDFAVSTAAAAASAGSYLSSLPDRVDDNELKSKIGNALRGAMEIGQDKYEEVVAALANTTTRAEVVDALENKYPDLVASGAELAVSELDIVAESIADVPDDPRVQNALDNTLPNEFGQSGQTSGTRFANNLISNVNTRLRNFNPSITVTIKYRDEKGRVVDGPGGNIGGLMSKSGSFRRNDGGPIPFARGGMAKYQFGGISMPSGSIVPGFGNYDNVPALLTPGEFVIRREAVEKYGRNFFADLNSTIYNKRPDLSSPSFSMPKAKDLSVNSDDPSKSQVMYNNNYSVSVNVKSDSNADQIARTVIDQIKRIDSQRIRGNRF